MQTAATTTIDRDREYDQTAKTDTQGDRRCYCSPDFGGHLMSDHAEIPGLRAETPAIIGTNADRSVSPAILEFRNQELTDENRDLKEKLRVAYERITGFEKFYASFALKIDEFEMMFMNLTGSTAGEFAKRVDRAAAQPTMPAPHDTLADCGLPAPTPNEYEIGKCIFPRGHSGPCSIGV